MNSIDVKNTTEKVINDFVKAWDSFTALDVSNKVKETLKTVRHREVAPIVHELFKAGVEDYMTSAIDVTLPDGKITSASLFHPIYDEDNLDLIYPAARRTLKAVVPAQVPGTLIPNTPTPVPTNQLSSGGIIWNRNDPTTGTITSGDIFATYPNPTVTEYNKQVAERVEQLVLDEIKKAKDTGITDSSIFCNLAHHNDIITFKKVTETISNLLKNKKIISKVNSPDWEDRLYLAEPIDVNLQAKQDAWKTASAKLKPVGKLDVSALDDKSEKNKEVIDKAKDVVKMLRGFMQR